MISIGSSYVASVVEVNLNPPYSLQVEIGCFVSSKAKEDIDNSHINNDNLSVDQRVAKGKVVGVRFNKEAGRYFAVGDAVTVRVVGTLPELVLAVDKKFIKPLLILDIHGVLGEREPWTQTKSRKREREFITRPFCDEFLEFCFERFEVAVWSGALLKNINLTMFSSDSSARGRLNRTPLFVWSQRQTTDLTPVKSLRNTNKPLCIKEISKVFSFFPSYDATNTILLDNDMEKCVKNHFGTLLLIPSFTFSRPPSASFTPSAQHDDRVLSPASSLTSHLAALALLPPPDTDSGGICHYVASRAGSEVFFPLASEFQFHLDRIQRQEASLATRQSQDLQCNMSNNSIKLTTSQKNRGENANRLEYKEYSYSSAACNYSSDSEQQYGEDVYNSTWNRQGSSSDRYRSSRSDHCDRGGSEYGRYKNYDRGGGEYGRYKNYDRGGSEYGRYKNYDRGGGEYDDFKNYDRGGGEYDDFKNYDRGGGEYNHYKNHSDRNYHGVEWGQDRVRSHEERNAFDGNGSWQQYEPNYGAAYRGDVSRSDYRWSSRRRDSGDVGKSHFYQRDYPDEDDRDRRNRSAALHKHNGSREDSREAACIGRRSRSRSRDRAERELSGGRRETFQTALPPAMHSRSGTGLTDETSADSSRHEFFVSV